MDTLREMLGGLAREGWGGMEPDPKALQRDIENMRARALAEAVPVARLFATPEGQQVLFWLVRVTLLRPPEPEEQAAFKSADEYALRKARREGQNGIVFMILQAMQTAAGEPTEGNDAG